jgi:hypothetical protein
VFVCGVVWFVCWVDVHVDTDTNGQLMHYAYLSLTLISHHSPPSPTQNQPRTRSQARRVTQSPNEHHQPPRPSPDTISRLRPSTSYEDVGYGRGSFHVADIVSRNIYPEIRNSTVCAEPTPAILDAWNEMGVHFRERVYDAIVNRYGAVHGQEIVCEAR